MQLGHFGRQRLDLGVLGDVVRLLPRLIALISQATELLNVFGILSRRVGSRTIRPLRVVAVAVDSEVGDLQDLLGSASLVSGNFGPSHGFLARMWQRRVPSAGSRDTLGAMRRHKY